MCEVIIDIIYTIFLYNSKSDDCDAGLGVLLHSDITIKYKIDICLYLFLV